MAAATEGDSPGGPLTYELAGEIDALHHCDVCQQPIIDIEVVADWLLGQYGEPEERRADVEEALRRSGLEVGDPLSPNYCSYHAQITSE
ncbi:MAG: hypothetical protein R3C39_15015 [Dehalococcoidia bacterium]